MRPNRPNRADLPISFPEFLDGLLEQAHWRHDALVKLQRLYDLHAASILMDEEMRANPIFSKLTFNAPVVDRDDPLGLLHKGLGRPSAEP